MRKSPGLWLRILSEIFEENSLRRDNDIVGAETK